MITCLGRSCSVGLCVSPICECASFSFGFDGKMWDLIFLHTG